MVLSSTVAHTVAVNLLTASTEPHKKKDVLLYCARANKH
jgi:hypothetical protein